VASLVSPITGLLLLAMLPDRMPREFRAAVSLVRSPILHDGVRQLVSSEDVPTFGAGELARVLAHGGYAVFSSAPVMSMVVAFLALAEDLCCQFFWLDFHVQHG